jgi:hypothetical protein
MGIMQDYRASRFNLEETIAETIAALYFLSFT